MKPHQLGSIIVAVALAFGAVAVAATPGAPAGAAAATTTAAAKYSTALANRLAAAGPSDQIAVMVHMVGRADLRLPAGPRAAKRKELIARLKSLQALRHPVLIAQLARWKAAGLVSAYESFWVDNSLAVTATPAIIATIASRIDVESVDLDTGQITVAATLPRGGGLAAQSTTTEPNITATGAPTLWAQGIDGTGVVVANLDTGVDVTNPDLAARWRGGSDSWFDPYGQNATPTDGTGHGTSTMSLMVGAGSGGTNIGVAPGAKWVAAKIFNNAGTATLSAIHAAFQWVLDPDHNPATDDAPDVVNNSWTLSSAGCSTEFQVDLQVLRAANILPIFAAGNGGPAASSSLSPANLPEAFSVGGVDAGGLIDSGSSRGPSSCLGVSVYPSAVAPDVNVIVADLYGLYTSNTGTSFAAPQAAGVLALVMSRFPALTADQQANALAAGAVDLGPVGPDNVYGAGMISAPNAFAALTAACHGVTTTQVTATPPAVSSGTVTVAAHSVACSGHSVASAEWFVDGATVAGTGTPFTASVPAFGTAAVVDETMSLPAGNVAGLASGPHTISVDAVDESGAWGAVLSTSFTIDRTGPAVTASSITPNVAAPSAIVQLTATAADPANGAALGSTVAGAEWFDGGDPGVGFGHPLTATDGVYNTSTEAAKAAIALTGWAPGAHTVSVRAVDAVGNWGAPVTSTLVIDANGPVVNSAAVTPASAPATATVALTATVTDPVNGNAPAGNVAGAEWFEGTDPGVGHGHSMSATDGAFGSNSEAASAAIAMTGWTTGAHTLSVRGVDAVGNWGPSTTVTITVTAPVDNIFNDGFESGTLAAWNGPSAGGSRLAVTTAAHLVGTYGLAATLGGISYVQDNSPTAEPSYHARFVFHPNGSLPGTGNQTIFAGLSSSGQVLVAVIFHRTSGGVYQLALQATSGNRTNTTSWVTITNGAHTVELAWRAASSGSASLLVDATAAGSLSSLSTATARIETARLGPSAGVANTTQGSELFDAFASTHTTAIGPP